MSMRIDDICTYAPKSGIKAGEATKDGRYMFFTSSEDESKRYTDYLFDGEGIIRIFTAEEAQLLFNAILEQNAEGTDFGFYKVFAVQNGREEFIGMGAITQNDEFDAPEIEYMLLPQFWNCGYGSELVGLLIEMAQDNAKIVAITDPENIYSRRILLKKGFKSVRQYENDDGEQAELFQQGVPL